MRFSTIFSNSTMSKITFVALRRFIYPPSRWGGFGVIDYLVWSIGQIAAPLLSSPLHFTPYTLHFTPYTLHSTPAAPLLSSDEQRPPLLRRQRTATSPMLHQQGKWVLDFQGHHHLSDCGGWWGRFAYRCHCPVRCYTQGCCRWGARIQMVDRLWIGRRCSRPAHLAPNKRTAA